MAILPSAFTDADRAAGYRYQLSILQAEFSRTQVLDRPVSGRVFFEQVIRDNLDAGRPDQVSLIFDRRLIHGRKRSTSGRLRTRVITDGVTPSLHIDYKLHRPANGQVTLPLPAPRVHPDGEHPAHRAARRRGRLHLDAADAVRLVDRGDHAVVGQVDDRARSVTQRARRLGNRGEPVKWSLGNFDPGLVGC